MIELILILFGLAILACGVGIAGVGVDAFLDGRARRRDAKQAAPGTTIALSSPPYTGPERRRAPRRAEDVGAIPQKCFDEDSVDTVELDVA